MAAPVEDRLSLLRAVRANLSPIYALYRGPCAEIVDWMDAATSIAPFAELTDEAGVEHRMWVNAGDDDDISRWLADEQLLIADGHHRYTTALLYRDEMHAAHGPGPWARMMMLL